MNKLKKDGVESLLILLLGTYIAALGFGRYCNTEKPFEILKSI